MDHFSFSNLLLINSRFFPILHTKQNTFQVPENTIFCLLIFNLRYLLNHKSKSHEFYVHGQIFKLTTIFMFYKFSDSQVFHIKYRVQANVTKTAQLHGNGPNLSSMYPMGLNLIQNFSRLKILQLLLRSFFQKNPFSCLKVRAKQTLVLGHISLFLFSGQFY